VSPTTELNTDGHTAEGQELSALGREGAALKLVEAQMRQLEREFPEWFAYFDETGPDVARREEVVELMATAPNAFALGLLFGKYSMRIEIESITGRSWV